MAGLQLYNLADNSGGLILNLTLNVVLVPSFHGLGAAVAWTLTFFALGTARIIQVKGKVLGVLPFSARSVPIHVRTYLPDCTDVEIDASAV